MKKKGILRIELQSDLCAGSGFSYAGIVDSDINYDSYGIPYIPGRRIKGCLKDTALSCLYELYSEEVIDTLFGKRAADRTCGLRIGNAYIDNYEKITSELKTAMDISVNTDNYISGQSILEEFTSVLAQTKLENGVAEDNTLRFTRVVNQYSPIDKGNMVFLSEIEFDDEEDDTNERLLCATVKATKTIGLKRTRGMGSVCCSIKDIATVEQDICSVDGQFDLDDEILIKYTFINEEALMLSSNQDNVSADFVSGRAVLGSLAARYLNMGNNTPQDEMFKNLFLSGQVKYRDAYPSNNGECFYPAPEYINILKKSKVYVNILCENTESDKDIEGGVYCVRHGNLPKKLKGKYVSLKDNAISIKEVDKTVVYHHSKTTKNVDGNEGILYSFTAIKPGQEFTGTIVTSARYKDILLELLQRDLYFGKSKTAEYGKCRIVDVKLEKKCNEKISVNKEAVITVDFLSDSIFMDDCGYTTDYSRIKQLVADELGLGYIQDTAVADSRISVDILNGYSAVWNLRKQAVPVVKAGSYLTYKLAEDAIIDKDAVGERNIEGSGLICVRKVSDMKYAIKNNKLDINLSDVKIEYAHELILKAFVKRTMDILCENDMNKKELNITASGLGRITLMLKESMQNSSSFDCYKDYLARLNSIKTDKLKNEAKKLLKTLSIKESNNEVAFNDKKYEGDDRLKKLFETAQKLDIEEAEIKSIINDSWATYLMDILTRIKYNKKIMGGEI